MALKDQAVQPVKDRISPLRVFGLCTTVILVFIAADLAFFAQGASFKREGGGLENASAFLYFVAVATFMFVVPEGVLRKVFHVPLVLLFFALRELDFDKAFTPSGILSTKLYAGDAPLVTKLISLCVALIVVWAILRTAWRGIPAMWRGLKEGAQWPWYAAAAGATVVGTKSIDGLGRKLLDFGIEISDSVDATAALVEEVGEAFIPVFAIMAILARWRGGIDERDTSRSPSAD